VRVAVWGDVASWVTAATAAYSAYRLVPKARNALKAKLKSENDLNKKQFLDIWEWASELGADGKYIPERLRFLDWWLGNGRGAFIPMDTDPDEAYKTYLGWLKARIYGSSGLPPRRDWPDMPARQ
jgi:hypothetical protein